VSVFGRGRVCAAAGCGTVFSVYNPASCCVSHEKREVPCPSRTGRMDPALWGPRVRQSGLWELVREPESETPVLQRPLPTAGSSACCWAWSSVRCFTGARERRAT